MRSSLAQLLGSLASLGKLQGESSAPSFLLFLAKQAAMSEGEVRGAEVGWSRASEGEAAVELKHVSSKASRPYPIESFSHHDFSFSLDNFSFSLHEFSFCKAFSFSLQLICPSS